MLGIPADHLAFSVNQALRQGLLGSAAPQQTGLGLGRCFPFSKKLKIGR
jgi:hypothetical protein